MRVAKLRGIGGGAGRTQHVAVCHFYNGGYAGEYDLGYVTRGDTAWNPVYEDRLPEWARQATRRKFETNN